MTFELEENYENIVNIKVVGVGGGGSREEAGRGEGGGGGRGGGNGCEDAKEEAALRLLPQNGRRRLFSRARRPSHVTRPRRALWDL